MKEMKTGITGNAEILITEKELACTVESGSLPVAATPVMVAMMEKAACNCINEYMENDETTVGTELNVKHVAASPLGAVIKAEAELLEINSREFTFNVRAYDNSGLIGEGIHKRFLVFGEKFTAKANAKLNK